MCVRGEPCVALGDLAEGRRARVRTRAPGGDPLGPRGALGAGPRPVATRGAPGPRADAGRGGRGGALAVLRERGHTLPQGALARVVNEVSDAVVGLGPIEFLLKDPEVTEGMVNGPDDG